ncbi:MAG: hypothetical protein ACE15E_10655 [Acidobacteriota bacterium]
MQVTGRMPTAGLRALLGNSLDYAGFFPPARLTLDQATKNYAGYSRGPDAWFLGRFVCPVHRLAELDPYVSLFSHSVPLLISALALPIPTWRESIPRLEESLDLILRFQRSHAPRVRVDSVEIALPPDSEGLRGLVEIRELIPAAANVVEQSGVSDVTPFFEVTASDWFSQGPAAIDSIARHNQAWTGVHCRPAAFKLRTGSVRAEAFPSIDRVAFVINACAGTGVRLKCTAGLHHPFRHYDGSVATTVHGFLNVFAGAVLVHARSLESSDLPSALEDDQRAHFRFFEDGLAWNDACADIDQIESARRDLIVSFGSCSFEEPLKDLEKLDIL